MSNQNLSPKQKAFCETYASNGGNATQAARVAGYKKARQMGSENLSKPDIQQYIAHLTDKVSDERVAIMTERQEFWTSVLRGEEASGTDSEGNDVFDMKHRLKASELLGKSQGDFIDRKIITGAKGANLSINVVFDP